MAIVVSSEALEKGHDEAVGLGCSVGQLMPGPVVFAHRNKYALVDVKRRGQPLGEDVHNVIVTVGAVVEFDTKGALPLLCLENMVSVGCMEDKAFEVELAHTANFWSELEVAVQVIADAVGSFEKTHLRVEIRTNFPVLGEQFKPVGLVLESCSDIGLPRRNTRRSRLGSIRVHEQVLEKDKASVRTAGLVGAVQGIAGTLIDPHHTDIRTAAQGTFRPHHCVISTRAGSRLTGVHVHNAQLEIAQ